MREIKFKYYCGNCKLWHYITLSELCESKAKDFRVCNEKDFNASGFKEYTGLKDSKGKKIYEGDILKISSDEQYTKDAVIVSVEFFNGSFVDSYFHWPLNNIKEYKREIIGNIYENPELLEAEK